MYSPHDDIKIIPSEQINRTLWDHCIANDTHARIYARSWLLDELADQWDGIILKDYQAVMPLPVKSRFGLHIVYTPPFIQQLGVFGRYTPRQAAEMSHKAAQHVKLLQYTAVNDNLFDIHYRQRTNFYLPLHSPYEQIAAAYTTPCKKNISKAERRHCVLDTENVTAETVIRFYISRYGNKSHYTPAHFERLKAMLQKAYQHNQCMIAGVRNEVSGAIVYAGLLLDDGYRLYYLLGAPNEEGRHMRAPYFFIDRMIRQFAGQHRILDFEGSDIPDVAVFYRSFSPLTEYYYQYYVNNYPFPFNKFIDWKLAP